MLRALLSLAFIILYKEQSGGRAESQQVTVAGGDKIILVLWSVPVTSGAKPRGCGTILPTLVHARVTRNSVILVTDICLKT